VFRLAFRWVAANSDCASIELVWQRVELALVLGMGGRPEWKWQFPALVRPEHIRPRMS
jgi:hypothetical protein